MQCLSCRGHWPRGVWNETKPTDCSDLYGGKKKVHFFASALLAIQETSSSPNYETNYIYLLVKCSVCRAEATGHAVSGTRQSPPDCSDLYGGKKKVHFFASALLA